MSNNPVLSAVVLEQRTDQKHAICRQFGEAFPQEGRAALSPIMNALPPDGRVVPLVPELADDEPLQREMRHLKPELLIGTNRD